LGSKGEQKRKEKMKDRESEERKENGRTERQRGIVFAI